MLNEVLPPSASAYLSFIQFLSRRNELDAASVAWTRLLQLHLGFPPKAVFPYIGTLIGSKRPQEAQRVWEDLCVLNPSLRALSSAPNLVVNGGFEQPLLNGGFDWWFGSYSGVSLSIDTSQFHGGSRSLLIVLSGQSVTETGLQQFVPVEPGKEYEFSAFYRAEEILAAEGLRFSVTDAYDNSSYVRTPDVVGSTPWRQVMERFTPGPNTHLVRLSIVGAPGKHILGRFWVDDVSIIPQ
jgi:hypothetical protein